MNDLRVILRCCGVQFRRWPSTPRIYLLALLITGYLSVLERPLAEMAVHYGIRVTPFAYPLLTDNWYTLMLLMLGLTMLFCDAPFLDAMQPYLVLRAGRVRWAAAQMVYILAASAAFVLFTAVVSALLLLPNLSFSGGWGKVFATLATTDAGMRLNVSFPVSQSLLQNYTPVAALLLSLFMTWLVGAALGLMMFAINMHAHRAAGMAAASLLIFWEVLVNNAGVPLLYYFSPVSWAQLESLDDSHSTLRPPVLFAVCFLFAAIDALAVLIFRAMRKKHIDVSPPV